MMMHIVRKWKSEAGTGNELIMLQVPETGVMNVSRADVAELARISHDGIKESG